MSHYAPIGGGAGIDQKRRHRRDALRRHDVRRGGPRGSRRAAGNRRRVLRHCLPLRSGPRRASARQRRDAVDLLQVLLHHRGCHGARDGSGVGRRRREIAARLQCEQARIQIRPGIRRNGRRICDESIHAKDFDRTWGSAVIRWRSECRSYDQFKIKKQPPGARASGRSHMSGRERGRAAGGVFAADRRLSGRACGPRRIVGEDAPVGGGARVDLPLSRSRPCSPDSPGPASSRFPFPRRWN